MNREQFKTLIAALEQISPPSRRDAFERALRVVEGGSTFDEAFGPAWGEHKRDDGAWGSSSSNDLEAIS